jgi:hypothetical protein
MIYLAHSMGVRHFRDPRGRKGRKGRKGTLFDIYGDATQLIYFGTQARERAIEPALHTHSQYEY